MVDLRNCFLSDEEIKQAQQTLTLVKNGQRPTNITDTELWNLKKSKFKMRYIRIEECFQNSGTNYIS